MNLEHLLTEENRQIRETIREFTKKEIIPNAKKLEADYSLVEEVHQKLVDTGIQSAWYPAQYGGGGHVSFTNLGNDEDCGLCYPTCAISTVSKSLTIAR